jgi:hypothetical protein
MTGRPSSAPSPDAPAMRKALADLAAQLGQTPTEIAGTLHAELVRAFDAIDAGIAAGDAEAVGRATHAARNSVLMLGDAPMLAGLRALETAVIRGDGAATARVRAEVEERRKRLAEVLRGV